MQYIDLPKNLAEPLSTVFPAEPRLGTTDLDSNLIG